MVKKKFLKKISDLTTRIVKSYKSDFINQFLEFFLKKTRIVKLHKSDFRNQTSKILFQFF